MGISTSLDANGNETRSPLPRRTMAGKARRIMPMEKTFDPAAIEAKWAHEWESRGLYRPSRPDATPVTILKPPPNVNGAPHTRHAPRTTQTAALAHTAPTAGTDTP